MTEAQYHDFIQPYEEAKRIMLVRLDGMKRNLYGNEYYPIHNIQERIKKKNSIEEKLAKAGLELSLKNAKDYLQDIAGIRVICYFRDDIYNLVEAIKRQRDIILIREKDYIKRPKPNGYRSYHLIVGIPVYYLDVMEYFPVEIQLRTMEMDLWASREHRILYKKNRDEQEQLEEELKKYAELLQHIEGDFEKYSVQAEGR